jgi:outer membrane protein assembly factor BamB
MIKPYLNQKTLVLSGLAALLLAPSSPRTARGDDWPMWGRTPNRNMVSPEKGPPTEWNWDGDDPTKNQNIKWSQQLGSKAYGNPCVANGIVTVGTNNFGPLADVKTLDPNGKPTDGGVEIAFDESSGKLAWQEYYSKLAAGRVNDWPGEGLCSTAYAEPGKIWFCTNQCHLVCLDVSPANGNQPKVVWDVDLMAKLGVFPHNMTASSPVTHGDLMYIMTGNGVDDTHKHVVAPNAPGLVCVNKNSGEVKWTDNSPGRNVLHGQWSSVAIAEVGGRALVIASMGDAWVRAFDAETGKLVWKFDANIKDSIYPQGGRNEIIATPCIIDNKWMYIATGQDPEHSTGYANFWCVDITRTGDVSAEIDNPAYKAPEPGQELVAGAGKEISKGVPNPNSGVRWLFGPGKKGDKEANRMHRSMATATVYNGLVFIPDFSGYFHCLDAETGKQYWCFDSEAEMWGSALACDGKIYVGDGSGNVSIFTADKAESAAKPIAQHDMGASVFGSPVYSNGTLYILSMQRLFAISDKK